MTINGTYIQAKGTHPEVLAVMLRSVIHCNLFEAWVKELVEKGTGRKWK